MNDAKGKPDENDYACFGIDFIPEQKSVEKKEGNIPFLKQELSNKKYGIEILEETGDDTDSADENFSSSAKEYGVALKNKMKPSDNDHLKEEDIYQ
jgi:hypothetical protein